MQVNFLPLGLTGDLWARGQKVNILLQSQFQKFYTTLCVCSHKQKIEHILKGIFILFLGLLQGWDFGVLGG